MPNAPSLSRTRGLAAAACCRAAWHSAGSLWPLRAVVADFRWPTCTARCGCRPTCIPKCRTCAAAAAAQHPLDDHQARDATRTLSPQPPSIHIDVIEPLVLSSWSGSLRCRTFLEPSSNLPPRSPLRCPPRSPVHRLPSGRSAPHKLTNTHPRPEPGPQVTKPSSELGPGPLPILPLPFARKPSFAIPGPRT